MSKKKSVLVTGGKGFIGFNLCKKLLDDGESVVVVDNGASGEYVIEHDNIEYFNMDINDIEYNAEVVLKKYKVVYHLAALPRIQFSLRNPRYVFKANALGTQTLLDTIVRNGIPIVYAGTSSVHGDVTDNPYTLTKFFGEKLIETYCKHYNVNAAVTRFYNVYGNPNTYQDDYGLVMTIFEKQYRNGEKLTVTGDGEQRRDFTHVEDICDGFILAAKRLINGKMTGYNEFELGTGHNYSINELAKMFGREIKYIPARDGEMRETLANNSRAKGILNWFPKDRLKEYVDSITNSTTDWIEQDDWSGHAPFIEDATDWTCSHCGDDTSKIEYDYIGEGTNHLECDMKNWEDNEARMDIIGQNGNDGLHYEELEPDENDLPKIKKERK